MPLLHRRLLAAGALVLTLGGSASAGTHTVTNTNDDGPGSLRQAITDANANAPGTVVFAIASGHQKIRPLTPLPRLLGGNIDGTTQPGYAGTPLIEIDGSVLFFGGSGLTVSWGWIDAVIVNGCVGTGVQLDFGGGVRRSYIGTDETGTIARPNTIGVSIYTRTTVGGPRPGEGNVISGNVTGIRLIYGNENFIHGNRIGTDPTGMSAIPNQVGIDLDYNSNNTAQVGGPTPWHGNLISGNSQFGIRIGGGGGPIRNNVIGPDSAGGSSLPAQPAGILLSGTTDSFMSDNVIAYNDAAIAVYGSSAVRNRFAGNRIYGNEFGIDLAFDHRTPNDAGDVDLGSNLLQNFPVLEPATVSGGLVTVRGSLNSITDFTFDIELFATRAGDTGQVYVGTVPVTTDASGNGAFSATFAAEASAGDTLLATATDIHGDTSELSDPAPIAESTVLVTSLSPDSGAADGGTEVVLTGTGFQADATVTFGMAPSAATVSPPGEILATAPALPPGTIHSVIIANGDLSTGGVANGWFADFLDVPAADAFHDAIEALVRAHVTAGCSGGHFCPLAPVTRAQMAVFLLRAKLGPAYLPPPATFTAFADVVWDTFAPDWIEDLARRGITGGCGNGNFCPTAPVRRDQMAVFLLKAEHGSDYVPPLCTGVFSDVPCSSPFAVWIEQLVTEGITAGCMAVPPTYFYCPADNVTRGQMAALLTETFDLP